MTAVPDIFGGYDIAIGVLAIMLSAAGILLGIGFAANDRKLKELGRAELYQVVVNAAIIGALFLAFSQYGVFTAIINNLTNSSVSQPYCDPILGYNSAICFAYNYLVGSAAINVGGNSYPSLLTSTFSLLAPLTVLYVGIGTLSTINISVVVVSVGLAGLKIFLSPLHGIIDFLTANIFLIAAQAALLKFIAITAVPVLLPVGLILRTFYFTRRLGGAIIAVAIGFFAVFPMTYVFDAEVMNAYANGSTAQIFSSALGAVNSATSATQSISSSTYQLAQSMLSISFNSITFDPFSIASSFLSAFSNAFTALVDAIEAVVTFLIIQVFILPSFSLILTVISIRELARILGSEISFGRFDVF